MIKISKDTKLTASNLCEWYKSHEKDLQRYKQNYELFLNRDSCGRSILKLPFAKKLVVTSASATIGTGVTLSYVDTYEKGTPEKKTFDEIIKLFKKQTIKSHDIGVITAACTCGVSYELCYMSDDLEPVPKVAKYSATNAFVVYDDTVEDNSLYGIVVSEFYRDSKKFLQFQIYDTENKYEAEYESTSFSSADITKLKEIDLTKGVPHNMGRMPLTEFHNNEEQQGDFEQVIDLMKDRTVIHDLNIKDMKALPKTALKGLNVGLAGDTEEEQVKTRALMERTQMLQADTTGSGEGDNTPYELDYMSKPENYSSIDVYGRDVDSKIYDLSIIPDLSSNQFAGNASGVALELKLKPFKNVIEAKDVYIERLYSRRLKMYIHALSLKTGFTKIDASDISITIKRNWTENLLDIAQTISTLASTGKISDKTLIRLIPSTTYENEKNQLEEEAKYKRKQLLENPDPNNAGLADYTALFRNLVPTGAADDNTKQL